jgi:hypothetical protein
MAREPASLVVEPDVSDAAGMTALRIASIALSTLALASCGSSGVGESCGKVEPCGGSLFGTWKAVASCTSASAIARTFQADCPAENISGVTATLTGYASFDYSRYSFITSGQTSFGFTFPDSCRNGVSCDELAARTEFQNTYSTVTCTGTSSCICHAVFSVNHYDMGTYTTSDNVITMVPPAFANPSYCVQGNVLHINDVDASENTGPMGQATILDDAVYIKQ